MLHEPESAELLTRIESAASVSIAAPALLECEIVVAALLGAEGLVRLDELIMALGAQIRPFTARELAVARSAFRTYGKGRHRAALNFGDCFSYALAVTLDEPLLFKGDDFSQTDVPRA